VAVSAPEAPTPSGGNRCAGRIALASYLGNTLRYDVETASGTLKADIRDAWHRDPLAPGVTVMLDFPASVTLALPADTPTEAARPAGAA
jgi:hypothetical protein